MLEGIYLFLRDLLLAVAAASLVEGIKEHHLRKQLLQGIKRFVSLFKP